MQQITTKSQVYWIQQNICLSLANQRVSSGAVEVLKNMYRNAQAHVKSNGQGGYKFEVHLGVKQDDPLSPDLFNAVAALKPQKHSLR